MRRIVRQVWDWIDRGRYVFHVYITQQSGDTWVSHHFASENGCLLRGELTSALTDAGFGPVRWLTPPTSAYRESISSRSLLVTASPATRRAAFSARSCLNARYTNEPMYQPSMYLYGVSPVV